MLHTYFNGSTSPSTFMLNGTVADRDVFIFAHASAVDPGTELGAGLVSTADNTMRRRPDRPAGQPRLRRHSRHAGRRHGERRRHRERRPPPAGSYAVTVTSTGTDGTTATCALTVQVTMVLSVGEVQGQTTDGEIGKADRSPLAPRRATARAARSTTCAA